MPSRVAQGIFFRDDGEGIPTNLLEETVEAFYDFRENVCPEGRKDNNKGDNDEEDEDTHRDIKGSQEQLISMGDALDSEFETWLKTEKVENA